MSRVGRTSIGVGVGWGRDMLGVDEDEGRGGAMGFCECY